MNFIHKGKQFNIERYPHTDNKSLKAWNAGDEYVLKYLSEKNISDKSLVVSNDKFGFLSTILSSELATSIVDYKSQEKAFIKNFEANEIDINTVKIVSPLSELSDRIDFGLIKIPKSTDLFRLYLNQIHKHLSSEGEVICSFMTKNFNKTILNIANEFFESVEQSLAWKKSRLLILKNKKEIKDQSLLNVITYNSEKDFKQYLGVFSAKNIDYASQYFINYISINDGDNKLLDLASGNGVLGYDLRSKCKDCELHLVDDSFLAVESSKLNLENENTHFHHSDSLGIFENDYFDLVVSNPPFHFEFENNIEISLELFKGVHRVLKNNGRFQLVANLHLNYRVHLEKIFSSVEILGELDKFVVYECVK